MSSVGFLGGPEPVTLQQRVHGAARPPTWHLDKLHRVLRVRRGIKNNGMKEDNLLSLSYGRIIPKDINTSEGLLPENFEGYQIVEPGNIVMRLTDLQNDKRSLRQGLVKERGIITSAYDALDVPKGQCPEFWFYSLLALDLAKHYYSLGGGVRQSVKFTDFPNDWIYRPDLTTQRQIADFLDRETARIDLLIEKKQRMVELTMARKLAAIQVHTLVESGMLQPLHRLVNVQTGKTPSRAVEEHFSSDEGVPWATPTFLNDDDPIVDTTEKLTALGMIGMIPVPRGTVLLNGIGASVGKVGVAGCTMTFNQQIHALIPKTKNTHPGFLLYTLIAKRTEIVSLANFNTIPILNGERLGHLEIPVLKYEQQDRIAEILDTNSRMARGICHTIQLSINRLREYRSALITAAVTGQIDPATHARAGSTDRHLDALQAEGAT